MVERKRTILCIEDERELVELYKLIFGRKGYNVVGALNGQEGLKNAVEEKPDLVLLDLMMPGMDGWAVYQRMRADERLRSIPVIIVTAKAQQIDKAMAIHVAKVNDYITKPFGTQELMESVTRVLGPNEGNQSGN